MIRLIRLAPPLLLLAFLTGVPAVVSGQGPVRVEIAESVYTATEGVDSEVEITVEMTASFGSEVQVGLDYGDDQRTVTFPAGSTSQVAFIPIVDDTVVEDETEIRIRLERLATTPSTVMVGTSYSVVRITDDPNDTATVGFESEVFEFSESETLAVISVIAPGDICIDFSVMMETTDMTADSPQDYTSIFRRVRFNNDCENNNLETRKSVLLRLVSDRIAEERETLRVTLSRVPDWDQRITIAPSEAIVTILDNDRATVELLRDLVVVDERDGSVVILIDSYAPGTNCPTELPVTVQLSTVDGTARSGQDYVAAVIPVTFEPCDRRMAVPLSIVDDATIERNRIEEFLVRLERTPTTPDNIILGRDEQIVRIEDNDERALGFSEAEHVLAELGSLDPEVAFDFEICPTDFDFDLILSTMDPYRAVSSGSQIPTHLPFKACESSRNFTVNASDVEATAEVVFALRQSGTPIDRIIIRPWYSKVAIIDEGGATEAFENLDSHGNDGSWGIWSNGQTTWVSEESGAKIFAYNMDTKARDSDQDFDTLDDAGNDSPKGIWSDGTTMWVADHDDGKLYAYQMSARARDPDKDFNTLSAAGNANPTGLWSDGTTMWVADDADDKVYAYNMATKTRDAGNEFNSLDSANSSPEGIWSDGQTMWVADTDSDRIFAYNMNDKLRTEDKEFNFLQAAGQTDPGGIWSDDEIMWAVDGEDDKIYAYYFPVEPVQPRVVRRTSTVSQDSSESDESDPARPSVVSADCVSEVVDEDGGDIELGDTIADRWVGGCPSVTRGGRLAKYYSFTLSVTTAVEIALDSHLDTYLVLLSGGLSGSIKAKDDDSGPSNNSLIAQTVAAGQYTIEATTFYADGVEADFTLTVRAVPRILYDGPVSDVAHEDYAPAGPTMTIKLLPTLPMGTLQITIEDENGFGEGAGPLGGEQTTGGSAGQVLLALPKTAWVEYGEATVEVKQSGSWSTHTRSDEQSMLAGDGSEREFSEAMQQLLEIVNQTEGASELVETLTGMTFSDTGDGTAQPDESLLDTVFRESSANCVSQVTLPWLVSASATTGVRVSVPVTLSDNDPLSVAASFVASGDQPALAQLHDLLATHRHPPRCQPPVYTVE